MRTPTTLLTLKNKVDIEKFKKGSHMKIWIKLVFSFFLYVFSSKAAVFAQSIGIYILPNETGVNCYTAQVVSQ